MRVSHPIARPPILGYLHHAFPLSVLFGKGGCQPWFYSNYVQLACPSSCDFKGLIEGRRQKFDFYVHPDYYAVHPHTHCSPSPLLDSLWFDREIAAAEGRLVAFILHALDRGYCVELCVDEYHVPGMGAYHRHHRTHEVLISGYDLETRSFVVSIGFDAAGDYTVDEVAFDEVERAAGSADLTGHYNQLGMGLLRPTRRVEYRLDAAWIVRQLRDYLDAANTSERFRALRTPDEQVYGVAVYGWLRRYFEHLADHHDCYDIRPIHILWEHKCVMADRARYLAARGLVDDEFAMEFDQIAADVAVLRMMLLKARVTRDSTLIERIAGRIDGIREAEVPVLQALADALDPRARRASVVARGEGNALDLRRRA